MRSLLLVVLFGCGGAQLPADTDDTDDTDDTTTTPAPPTTPPTTTDTDVPATGLFVEATGTVDGESASVYCGEEETDQLAGSQSRDQGTPYLTAACVDTDSAVSISLGAFADGTAQSNNCNLQQLSAQVVDLTTGASWNCAVDPSSTFAMMIDEYTVEADESVTWGGTFRLAGPNMMGLTVDLNGSFRVNSPCDGAGC